MKRKITTVLREIDAWYFFPQGTLYGRGGIPDILALVQGVLVGIEAKSGRNRPTDRQKAQLRAIRQAGGLSLVVNEENLEAFTDLMRMLAQSPTRAVRSYFQGEWPTLTKLFEPSPDHSG